MKTMKPGSLPKSSISSTIWHVTSIAVAVSVFSLILINRSPNLLRPLSLSLRTGFGLVIPAAALLVYIAFRVPGRFGWTLALTATMALFAFPLAGLWASGQTQSTVISGLIPLYDAGSYYDDAVRLMDGQEFDVFSARRPLFPGLLSVLLSMTGRNLMASLAILTAVTALAACFTAKEIQHTHGAEPAVFVLLIVFLFYRAHSGVTMSENLGVALGTLGFGLLWRGILKHNMGITWLGLLATTLALNARAGAFFMLPLLTLWAGWFFREPGRRFSGKAFLIGASAVITGFALNLILTRMIAVPSGVPFANFSYTLYGLASGGESWAYVFEAHPELQFIQEPEQSKRIYQLAFALIRENPWQTVQGAFFNWKMLFSNTWYNVYSYVGGENWNVNLIARWGLYLLSVLGIWKWLRNPKDPASSLVMVAIFGIFVSVPFLPPTDAYRMRPYAASIVVLGALPALGLTFLTERWKTGILDKPKMDSRASGGIAVYTAVLIVVALVGPVIVKSVGIPPILTRETCTSSTDFILIRFDPGTSVNIHRENREFLDWMPDFHQGQFKLNAHALPDRHLIQWADEIEAPISIFHTFDYASGHSALVTIKTEMLPEPGTRLQLCGAWETSPDLIQFAIFHAEETIVLP